MSDSPDLPAPSTAARYVAWIDRHRVAVLVVSALVAIGSALAASTLPVYSDFARLLPPSTQSVQDLRKLEKRARVLGTLMVAVKAEDPARRSEIARGLRDRLQALGPGLVSSVTFDQSVGRQYFWDNRWLFAPLEDLEAARDGLADHIEQAKLKANPLYVDFEDEEEGPAAAPPGLAELRTKLKEAETKKSDPGLLVSKDGTLQMMILRTPFSAGDVGKSGVLLAEAMRIVEDARRANPGVEIGLAGDIATAKSEHDDILNGMLIATILTGLLVVGAMILYYRSTRAVLAEAWALAVGTVAAFAFTRATIGHLNIATAFLSSIVIGNGVNFGLLLLARHMEERRAGRGGLEALAIAVDSTARGTLTAALTATVSYASLLLTDFRGFRHFGVIGGTGMVLCWISTFTVLPAAMAVLERRGWIKVRPEPKLGAILNLLLPKRLGVVAAIGLVVTGAAGFQTLRFLTNEPYESNFKNLRSDSAVIQEERRWMRRIDEAFGQGISGGFAVAVEKREDARALVAKLRAADQGKSEQERLFSRVNSLDDLLPADQEKKVAVLAEIRAQLTPELLDKLSPEERADVERLRPPEALRPLKDEDVPELLAWPFIEADGSRGKIVLAMSGWGYEIWNAHDLVRFSEKVRALDLGEGTVLGGQAFVFADMLALMQRDGPLTTGVAIIAAMLVVLLLVGRTRYAAITLFTGGAGVLLMLATVSLLGLKINFLDFVALPLTIGLGIDYAVNITSRARLEGPGSARRALTTTGGAVFLCSYSTVVGYGSLLLSANKGIRSFGIAALFGELMCLVAALLLVPALLDRFVTEPKPEPTADPGQGDLGGAT